MKKLFLLGLSLSLFFASCSTTDEPFKVIDKTPTYENGILFLNEGNFNGSNGSIGFVDYSFGNINPNVVKTTGNVAQSMAFKGSKAFVVMNNSNTIEIFDRYTLKYETSIKQGLNQPRYISFVNNEIYVTNYGSKSVSVYKDTSYDLVAEIVLDTDVDHIVTSNNKLYVQKAAFGVSGTEIAIIDPVSKKITKTIDLKTSAPSPDIVLQGLVAHGDFVYAIASSKERSDFFKINNIKDEVIVHFNSTQNKAAQNLRIDDNRLYYTSLENVYTWDINDITVKVNPTLTLSNSDAKDLFAAFYGFDVINSKIYVGNANDYVQPSTIKVYNLKGEVLKQFKGGQLTNSFYNNYKF